MTSSFLSVARSKPAIRLAPVDPLGFASRGAREYRNLIDEQQDGGRMVGGALAATFMAQRSALLRYLRARGGGDETEDLLHELWFKLEAAGEARPDDPTAYLYRMAHNLMLDRRRAASRRVRREESFHREEVESEPPPSAERLLIARQQLGEMDRTLRSLGERTDYIFRRHRVEEVPQRAIATELGISLSAVEKHLQKAYRAVAAAHSTSAGDEALPREAADGAR